MHSHTGKNLHLMHFKIPNINNKIISNFITKIFPGKSINISEREEKRNQKAAEQRTDYISKVLEEFRNFRMINFPSSKTLHFIQACVIRTVILQCPEIHPSALCFSCICIYQGLAVSLTNSKKYKN